MDFDKYAGLEIIGISSILIAFDQNKHDEDDETPSDKEKEMEPSKHKKKP